MKAHHIAGVGIMILMLSACAHTPEPKIVTREVKVPVIAPCVSAAVPPAPTSYPDDHLPEGPAAVVDRYRLKLAANERRKARLAIIEPVIAGCR